MGPLLGGSRRSRDLALEPAGAPDPDAGTTSRAAELAPILSGEAAGGDAPLIIDPDQLRFRLFDAAADLLRDAAQRRTLVMVMDDLQWADDASLLLLRFLVPLLPEHRLLVIATYRRPGPVHRGRSPR